VKVPFHQSGEDEVRLATGFQEAAYTAGVPTPQVRRTTEGCVFAAMEGRQIRVYEWLICMPPTHVSTRRWWARSWPPFTGYRSLTSARWTSGITNRSVPIDGTSWSNSFWKRERLLPAGWPICVMS